MFKTNRNIILDFDYTLFNAASLKREMMRKLGVSQKVFNQTYKLAVATHKNSHDYSVLKHLELIAKQRSGFNLRDGKKIVDSVLNESAKHMYAQSYNFLKNLSARGYKLILVTRGNQDWQSLKIKNTGVHNYFDKIIISPKWKTQGLKKMLKLVKRGYFVSDHIDEVKDTKKYINAYKPILKLRYKKDLQVAKQHSIPAFRTLKEIESYIVKNS